jgi:hypothetical protein
VCGAWGKDDWGWGWGFGRDGLTNDWVGMHGSWRDAWVCWSVRRDGFGWVWLWTDRRLDSNSATTIRRVGAALAGEYVR